MKSVEQKLYEAYRDQRGCMLTAEDVIKLLSPDEAIRTRIINKACLEQGNDEAGFGDSGGFGNKTWRQLGQD